MIPDWLYISKLSGSSGTTVITVSANTNNNNLPRLTDITASFFNGLYASDVDIYQYASGDTNYYENEYLSFEPVNSNCTIYWRASSSSFTRTIEYSRDNGGTWTSITSSTGYSASISLSSGQRVMFRGNNNYYAYMYGSGGYNYFDATGKCKVYGNILSLNYGDGFRNHLNELPFDELVYVPEIFYGLFAKNYSLEDAENLIFPKDNTMSGKCSYGYAYMFSGCTSLTKPPKDIYIEGYNGVSMFCNCTSLSATPYLSSTVAGAYIGMFENCTNLQKAELPATDVSQGQYQGIFRGCSKLKYIRCKALPPWAGGGGTGILYIFNEWVDGVPTDGTFVKDVRVEITMTEDIPANKYSRHRNSTSGIPNWWKVIDEYPDE